MTSGPANHEQPADNSDPLIDEVRAIRKELSDLFGNNVDGLCDYLKTVEERMGDRVVDLSGQAKGKTGRVA